MLALSEGLGKGSEFIMRLPLVTRAPVSEPSYLAARPMPEQFPLRLLVVDDNADAANSLSMLLQSLGHEVRAVYDGPAAIAMAQQFQPEVVLLDIGMPS